MGVSDITHELNLLFFNGFTALTPVLSHRDRGHISCFSCFRLPAQALQENAILQDFEQVLRRYRPACGSGRTQ